MRVLTQGNGVVNRGQEEIEGGEGGVEDRQDLVGMGRGREGCVTWVHGDSFNWYLLSTYCRFCSRRQIHSCQHDRAAYNLQCGRHNGQTSKRHYLLV